MATELDDQTTAAEVAAAAERRAWADDEITIYQPGDPIPAPPTDDE